MPTPYEIIETGKELAAQLVQPEVQALMKIRCESQGHEFENCCSAFFRIYRQCAWCGEEQ